MNYKAGEVLAAQLLEGISGFDSKNIGRGSKWKYLRSGNSDHYAVLRKGAHTEAFITPKAKEQQYRTVIEVLQRVRENLDDRYDDLLIYADAITTYIDTYRRLGNTDTSEILRDAEISGGDEVKEIWTSNGTVLEWIKIDLFLDWIGEKNVTFAE